MSNPYPPFNPQNGYGQSPYAQYQPPPSTAMATWALVLSFIPFLPTILASVGLAIAVLVRSGNGRNFGRKRAIVALVIDVLWFVGVGVVVVLIVLGKIDLDDTKRDASGHVTESNVIGALSVRVGDCFDQGAALPQGGETVPLGQVTVKPCTEAHHVEVYSEFDLESGDYPGEEAITALANDRCFAAVNGYAGHSPALRSVRMGYFFPLKRDWVIRHEHTVKCIFVQSKASTTSLKRG